MSGQPRVSVEGSNYRASISKEDRSSVEIISEDLLGLVRENSQTWLLAGDPACPTRIRLYDQGLSETAIRSCLALHAATLVCIRTSDGRLSCDVLTIALACKLLIDDFRAIEDRASFQPGEVTPGDQRAPRVRDASEIDEQPFGAPFWIHATPVAAAPSAEGCEMLFWIPSGSLWRDIPVALADGTAFNGLAAKAALFAGGSAPLLVRRNERGLTCTLGDLVRRAGQSTHAFDRLGRFPLSPRDRSVSTPEAAVRQAA